MLHKLLGLKFIVLYLYVISVLYTQFRGKVRLKLTRQLVNHSTLMAPINAIMYLFSAIPNKPFCNLNDFPQLTTLQTNWQVIRDEATQLFSEGHIKATTNNDDMGFNSFFKRGWKRFYLKWYEDFLPSAKELCPNTVALLKDVPGLNGVMFTLLPKGGQLKPHRDPFAGSIRYHLGLVTPNSPDCHITIDGTPYFWRDGEAVLFDETYIHAANNATDTDRIILFCDIERPMNNPLATWVNRFFCKYVLSESTTQNLPMDRVGRLNVLYRYYHRLSVWILLLKKKNKFLYQVLQYGSLMGLTYLIFIKV